jgi:hypothetical protein
VRLARGGGGQLRFASAERARDSRGKIADVRYFRSKILPYATSMAYAYFGYEGEAFSKGGYLLRGFNDLRWLPEVPADDSGTMPTGR